jgi:hypothetical protein
LPTGTGEIPSKQRQGKFDALGEHRDEIDFGQEIPEKTDHQHVSLR